MKIEIGNGHTAMIKCYDKLSIKENRSPEESRLMKEYQKRIISMVSTQILISEMNQLINDQQRRGYYEGIQRRR